MASAVLETSTRGAAFDALAESYDETFTNSSIGRAQRDAIRAEFDRVFRPGQRILEINCGTGVDAIYLAGQGVKVLACDAAPRMIEKARQRANQISLQAQVSFRVLPTEEIATLADGEKFDGALSNFAGLNCVADLTSVGRDLANLLKPGATTLVCLFGRFCAWETVWYLAQGNMRKAFRRLRTGGDLAQLAKGVTVRVHYPTVREVARTFAPSFSLRRWKGVGVAVPPTYMENVTSRFPKILLALANADRWLSRCPGVRGVADHVLLEFERVGS
jgi:ubiquinone/menaquinone biosynthesis C-methylase UbiE